MNSCATDSLKEEKARRELSKLQSSMEALQAKLDEASKMLPNERAKVKEQQVISAPTNLEVVVYIRIENMQPIVRGSQADFSVKREPKQRKWV